MGQRLVDNAELPSPPGVLVLRFPGGGLFLLFPDDLFGLKRPVQEETLGDTQTSKYHETLEQGEGYAFVKGAKVRALSRGLAAIR